MVPFCEKLFIVFWRVGGEESEFFVEECAWGVVLEDTKVYMDEDYLYVVQKWKVIKEFANVFIIVGEEFYLSYMCCYWYDCDRLSIVMSHVSIWKYYISSLRFCI